MNFDTVIFDLGGVLIDWNPRYVYKQIFVTDEAVEHFLENICTSHWNEQQDAGRSFDEATAVLQSEYPHYKSEIQSYYSRWHEMLGGPIVETVALLKKLHDIRDYRLLALTNWSAESFPTALERYDFLALFGGILVSGEEKLLKPDPAIFELLISRYNIDRNKALYIDDNLANVKGANEVGLTAIHFTSHQDCIGILKKYITF